MHHALPPNATGQRCADLPFPERLLLWAFRTWVVGLRRRIPVDEALHTAFGRIDAGTAVGLIDNFMAVVSHGAARVVNIDCPCRPEVSDDARRLLAALPPYQSGTRPAAPFLLPSQLPPPPPHLAAATPRPSA